MSLSKKQRVDENVKTEAFEPQHYELETPSSVIPSGPLAGLPVELAPYVDAATGLLTKDVVVQIKTQAFPVSPVPGAGQPIPPPPPPPSIVSITVGVGRSIAEVKVRMEKGAVLTDPFVSRRRRHTPKSIKPEPMEEAAKKDF